MTSDSISQAAVFEPLTMAADAWQLHQLFTQFFAAIPAHVNWKRHTERGGKGWTLHQTLAHVVATAEVYEWIIEATLAGQPIADRIARSGFASRTDLSAFNEWAIAERLHIAPATLIQTFLDILGKVAQRCEHLNADELAQCVLIPAYSKPISIAEVISFHLMHPGVVHAAQLANGIGTRPLWVQYNPELMQRQLARFLYAMPYIYWPERAGNIRAFINFVIFGASGGRWVLTLGPREARLHEGKAQHPNLILYARSPQALCNTFTAQTTLFGDLIGGQIFVLGDPLLFFRLSVLFSPT